MNHGNQQKKRPSPGIEPEGTRKLTVGVSILPKPGTTIWNNGINQNVAFLLDLLANSPEVGRVFLIDGGKGEAPAGELAFQDRLYPLRTPDELTHEIDLVIEMGTLLDTKWLRHVHAIGVKIVTFQVGHTYANNGEAIVFGRTNGITFEDPHLRDEIWVLPKSSATDIPMLGTLTRRPVMEVPHIWSPRFQTGFLAGMEGGDRFGFDPALRARRKGGWRVGIFEPNISVVKNSFQAMLVCEASYRANKESVGTMMVFNSLHMKEHATFKHFALNLDLTRDQKAWYEGRHVFSESMVRHDLDAVVSHHWENGQNYLYYDALHGGYPLIHNSTFLRDAGMGFYYPDFEAIEGGRMFLDAWEKDPGYWQDYRRKAAAYLETLSPEHPANISAFGERIRSVMGGRA